MTRSDELRAVISPLLSDIPGVKAVFYERATQDHIYPHIVYVFKRPSVPEMNRNDYQIDIDVWDRDAESATVVETICDSIENIFNGANLPNDKLLPTFWLESRVTVEDGDKTIRHRNIKVSVQFYERT